MSVKAFAYNLRIFDVPGAERGLLAVDTSPTKASIGFTNFHRESGWQGVCAR